MDIAREKRRLETELANKLLLATELEKRDEVSSQAEAKRQRQLADGIRKELQHLNGKDPGKRR